MVPWKFDKQHYLKTGIKRYPSFEESKIWRKPMSEKSQKLIREIFEQAESLLSEQNPDRFCIASSDFDRQIADARRYCTDDNTTHQLILHYGNLVAHANDMRANSKSLFCEAKRMLAM